VFDREILVWPGLVLAALGAVVLVLGRDRRAHFWGFDLLGGVGGAVGGLLIYESQRNDAPARLELSDLFEGIFTGWPQAALVAVIAAAAALVVVILLSRGIPSWQRVLALSVGVGGVIVLSHLWSAGL
jgi:hypothetical protein